ncbi:MAG: hypothetical protein WCY49_04400 [Anaerovoracaceae bacterium]|nr:hypothetical protein [Clostridiales bacterium]
MLLETYENYHVHFSHNLIEDRYSIYVREELGVIVAKTSQPPVVLAINESNMTAAFWDFLKTMIEENTSEATKNVDSIKALRNYLNEIKNS